MLTLNTIFNLCEDELNFQLQKFKDNLNYSNNLEKLNAVIINNYNNNQLNKIESQIVESEEYDLVIQNNPKSYKEFIYFYNNLLQNKYKCIKIQINSFNSYELLNSLNLYMTNFKIKNTLFFKMNEKFIISSSNNKSILIDDTKIITLNSYVITFNINEKYIIISLSDNTIQVFNFNLYCLATLEGHTKQISCISNDNNYIISGSWDNTIKVWNINTFKCIRTLKKHSDIVNCIAINDKYIVSGSDDKTIIIWNINFFTYITTLIIHTNNVSCLKINKNYLISGSHDNTIKIFDLTTFKFIKTLYTHNDWVNDISINENYIIANFENNIIRVWKK